MSDTQNIAPRKRRYGPLGSYHNPDPETEFVKRVGPPDENGCTRWQGQIATNGYGRFARQGTTIPAHRYAYERIHGSVPDGLELDHLCGVRSCVNLAHLEVVTHRENTLRGVTLTAANAKKTHCKHGHEFTPENTYRQTVGGRGCVECRRREGRERARRDRERRRAQ